MLNGLYNNFVHAKERWIKVLFDLYRRNRVDNVIALYIFYFLLRTSLYFYEEKEFKEENQHYIPKATLIGFSIPGHGQIYKYRKGGNEPYRASIYKEAATIKNYYSFSKIDNQDTPSNFVEKNLYAKVIERYSSDIIEDFVEGKYDQMISLEKRMVAMHAAHQYTRTPSFDEQLCTTILYLIDEKGFSKKFFSNKNKNKLINLFIEQNELDITKVRNYSLKLHQQGINPAKELFSIMDKANEVLILLSMVIETELEKDLFFKHISLIKAQDPLYFVLPDSGVVIIDRNYPEWQQPLGWNFSSSSKIIGLPISPDKAIIFSPYPVEGEVEGEFAKLIFAEAFKQKNNYIFSDRENEPIQKNTNKF